MRTMIVVAATTVFLGVGSMAFAAGEPAKAAKTSAGTALVDASGMTLYTFEKDAAGKSNCTGKCATNWPPLMAEGSAAASGEWTVITRDDGSKQWAYKGKPLYTWINDKKAGDAGGGKIASWHVATP